MVFGRHINKYYLKYSWMILLGLAALVVVDIMQLKIPEFYRMVVNGMNDGVVEVDGVMKTFDMDFLLDQICRPMLFVILAMVTGRFLWRVGFFGASLRVEADIRDEMFDHAKDLSQQYYQVNKVGNLMSLFTNDLQTIEECFGGGILTLADAVVLGVLSFYKMGRMDIRMTLFSLVPMAFMFVIALIVGFRIDKKWEERQEAFSKLSDYSQESFTGIAVIKAFAKEVKDLHEFRKLNQHNEKVNVQFVRLIMVMEISITLFIEAVICVILGYGGYQVHEGRFNAGQLIEFIGYFTTVVWPIQAIAFLIQDTARGHASAKRIGELLDAKIDVKDIPEKIAYKDPEIKGSIEFRHLDFTYPDGKVEVLRDASFTINAGENVGLIGRTGSGKTSVVDLITRTYNVPDNKIFIDGMDVNTIPIKKLREHIAYVPQDNFLFSDTISNNIAFAFEDDHDTEAIERAAKLAGVHDNIEEFPEKYKTVLGERGVTVSGGQKQRISIARALMKDAEILILDDSVSAVDTKTEKVIIGNLHETRKGKTTILIAHRISTVEGMDKIIFVDDGKILAVGSHKELLHTCKPYADLVEMQRLEDERKERE
ncbi:MAG: ABC transporter ATP-binding protein [Lachnospiraceae bacterium]|nr:ABC transporter ATP-binding protein [Lachnospiraceae bacterium]